MADIAGEGTFETWIRDGLAEAGADLDELADYAEEGAQLIRASLAPRTYDDYQAKFAAFDRWCATRNIRSLPAPAEAVALYLIHLARAGTTVPAELHDQRGITARPGGLSASSLAAILAAIGTIHRNHDDTGRPYDPTVHPYVRRLLAAYARRYPRRATQAHPIDLEDLAAMCDRTLIPAHDRNRDAALIAVATHPLVEVTASQLARSYWHQLRLPEDDGPIGPAALDVGGRTGTVWIPADVTDPALCPVRHLQRWRRLSPTGGPLFDSPARPGRPISRQGLAARTRDVLTDARVPTDATHGELPRLTAHQRRQVLSWLEQPDHVAVRDRAMMALLWALGTRAETASLLTTDDIVAHPDRAAIQVTIRRHKTDQHHRGITVAIPAQPGFVGCPIEALTVWLRRYAHLCDLDHDGLDLAGLLALLTGRPLLPALHRGRPGAAIGYDGINDTTKRWARAAGVQPHPSSRLSSHGFRAGNATVLLQQGVPAEAVAHHQQRNGTGSLRDYYRPGTDPDHSALANLTTPTLDPDPDPEPDPDPATPDGTAGQTSSRDR